ncbi:unnamed protein product [Phytophthora lilii]|uniref:Unnamed protein product n=1 Tax=Phytophthora lilii TaxID=2077276 RepID=A0A9W6WKR3_9STRA|nr:unnamed protein product [Phytophthora lilii]
MMDYELFKDVGGERSLGDKDWDRLIKNMPQHAQRLRLFKESGFPHVDICRRISAGKEDPNALAGQKVEAEPQAPTAGSVKRSNSQEIEAPKAKRVCAPVEHESVQWSHDMERLLLFLCWRLKNIRGVLVDEGIKPQMWLEVAKELNEHVKTNFNKRAYCSTSLDGVLESSKLLLLISIIMWCWSSEQVKAKYLDLLLHYDRFKLATGYSGVADSFPKTDLKWEQLMRERPRYHGELQRLKDDGGFPHVNICSLITGTIHTILSRPRKLFDG